jgi:DNA-binding LacI/PurR family transcriptional regulator
VYSSVSGFPFVAKLPELGFRTGEGIPRRWKPWLDHDLFEGKLCAVSEPRFLTITEQVAAYLRGEILRGRWGEKLPGTPHLAEHLGVNFKTVSAALRTLEREGILVAQGAGRKRLILIPDVDVAQPMRVGILVNEPADFRLEYMVEIRHALEKAGHEVIPVSELRRAQVEQGNPNSLVDPARRVARISRLVKQTAADAWVVSAGSREVLEWFSEQAWPTIALFGRRRGLPIASTGVDKPAVIAEATRKLIGLGHRRIVLLCRRMRRLPRPGESERSFLNELSANGIQPGAYHLPDWEESIDGFFSLLESLFQITPPTALLIDEVPFFTATQQFLARRRILVPEDVSLICMDPDPSFAWCRPAITHIRWDYLPIERRIVRWAAAVSRGKQDLRQNSIPAELVIGGTIGPVKGA